MLAGETTSDDEEELGGCPPSQRCSSPVELCNAEDGRWRQHQDAASQQSFYFNEATRRVQWDKPPGDRPAAGGTGAGDGAAPSPLSSSSPSSSSSSSGVASAASAALGDWRAARDRLSAAQSSLLEVFEQEHQLLGAALADGAERAHRAEASSAERMRTEQLALIAPLEHALARTAARVHAQRGQRGGASSSSSSSGGGGGTPLSLLQQEIDDDFAENADLQQQVAEHVGAALQENEGMWRELNESEPASALAATAAPPRQ